MQVRFALSTAPVFTRTDTETDSVRFYNTLLEFLEDPDEQEEVNQLLLFWNQYVLVHDFPCNDGNQSDRD